MKGGAHLRLDSQAMGEMEKAAGCRFYLMGRRQRLALVLPGGVEAVEEGWAAGVDGDVEGDLAEVVGGDGEGVGLPEGGGDGHAGGGIDLEGAVGIVEVVADGVGDPLVGGLGEAGGGDGGDGIFEAEWGGLGGFEGAEEA